ncbi:MAG: ribosome maturation factor RimM [Bacillota bacterium]
MTVANPGEYISIGRVVAPHGVRGGMVVLPLTDFPQRFKQTRRVFITKQGAVIGEGNVSRTTVLPGKVLVWLESVRKREDAAALVGCDIAVLRSEAVQIPEGSYFIFQIEGLRVVTTRGKDLGTVKEVLKLPANDVYVVRRQDGGELLIPAIRRVVLEIDLQGGKIVIQPMPGLLGDDGK